MRKPKNPEIDNAVSELLLNEGYTKAELARYLETTPETIDAVLMNVSECGLIQTIQKRLVCHHI
ncbi:MAG: hypothetical protein COV52_05185 [Gammaproteobacteria bacterium CG11_big_fil_rev_8_21_14_0_20_46_22]|nr:MAG: hypothetical protein COW05_10070 [Gammaproteobacteria bacterium CG12_big_fil_rev_8_21_14_0_65_46_12]PIR11190.1 MAG: hypothetical protein COV52_05185 [Gammaproteobacteria bacterium CG11_big_fil_rev_8_21_14_0_20_46_22]